MQRTSSTIASSQCIPKVAGKKALIEEAEFFVLHSTPEDPNSRLQFVQKLVVLNKELASALDDLTRYELVIIKSMGDKGANNENATNNK